MRLKLALLCFLIATSATSLAEELGRLFFTPQQRVALDRLRLQHQNPGPSNGLDGPLTLNGQVKRSTGHSTHWINGIPVTEREMPAPPAQLPSKVGETWVPGSGDKDGMPNPGLIKVYPARAEGKP